MGSRVLAREPSSPSLHGWEVVVPGMARSSACAVLPYPFPTSSVAVSSHQRSAPAVRDPDRPSVSRPAEALSSGRALGVEIPL